MSKIYHEGRAYDTTKSTIPATTPLGGGGLKWKAFLFTLALFVFLEIALVMYAGLSTTRHMIAVKSADDTSKEDVIVAVKQNLGLLPPAGQAAPTVTLSSINDPDSVTYQAPPLDSGSPSNASGRYYQYVTVNNTLTFEGFAALYTEMCEAFFIPRTVKADVKFNDVFAQIVVQGGRAEGADNHSVASSDNGGTLHRAARSAPDQAASANHSLPVTSSSSSSHSSSSSLHYDRPLCPCVPPSLVGQRTIDMHVPYLGEMELLHPEIQIGGHWEPPNCLARHRTAIIIPFRDREEHLTILLNYLHPLLQNQQLYYTIFVVEQVYPAVFNKASIMNTGYREATLADSFDCFIFHDVDMIPENDYNFYTCTPMPRHVGSHCDKFGYKVPYPNLFGGVTAFTAQQFQQANGFSNEYYGWGGEDDDMFQRVKSSNMNISRFPSNIARYTMIKHGSDAGNPYNSRSYLAWSIRPTHYKKNGVNTLKYYRREIEQRPLYTWILVELPDPRPPESPSKKSAESSASSGSSLHRCRQSATVPSCSLCRVLITVFLTWWWLWRWLQTLVSSSSSSSSSSFSSSVKFSSPVVSSSFLSASSASSLSVVSQRSPSFVSDQPTPKPLRAVCGYNYYH